MAQLADYRTLQLPLVRPEWAELRVPYPLTEADWEMLTTVLDLMRPGLVGQSDAGAPVIADREADAGGES